MTKHNFEVGKEYRTRGGEKVWFVGVSSERFWPLVFDHGVNGFRWHNYDGMESVARSEHDIIGLWEGPEIDVANMWVAITEKAGHIVAHRRMYRDKPESSLPANIIAILRVSEWEAIKRGERKLIKGEGL